MTPKALYEDNYLLVLDKEAGITVNRSDTTRGEETVQDLVESYLNLKNESSRKAEGTSDFSKRSGIVHRLDKETSGILLVAKSESSFLFLQNEFKERKVKKIYIALVHGTLEPKSGEIRVPVGRLPWNRKRFGIVAGGRDSITFYKTLGTFQHLKTKEKLTLLELYPQTGRTHQIRVHLKYLNHPIFSDILYAGRKTARSDRSFLNRIFLHAHKIVFTHPTTHQEMTFESPLPFLLAQFLHNYSKAIL